MKSTILVTLSTMLLAGWANGATQDAEVRSAPPEDQGVQIIETVTPEIPAGVIKHDRMERVIVEFTLTKEGVITKERVLYTLTPELKAPVLEAIRQWKLEPKVVDGKAVESRVRVPIELSKESMTLIAAKH